MIVGLNAPHEEPFTWIAASSESIFRGHSALFDWANPNAVTETQARKRSNRPENVIHNQQRVRATNQPTTGFAVSGNPCLSCFGRFWKRQHYEYRVSLCEMNIATRNFNIVLYYVISSFIWAMLVFTVRWPFKECSRTILPSRYLLNRSVFLSSIMTP